MNLEIFNKNQSFLLFQRNVFAAFSFLLAISLIIMSGILFLKGERIVIAPPFIEKEFWVESKCVSSTYLEQFGVFLGQLLLSKSSSSAPSQRNVLLRHVDPSYVGVLKQKLFEEEETLKKQNSSYVFFPVNIEIDQENMKVSLTGDRVFYVSGKQVSSEREGYVLSFSYSGSALFLNGIDDKKRQ